VAGAFPLALSKGGRGAVFITVLWVILWFFKIELKQIYCSYSGNKKTQFSLIIFEVNIVAEQKQKY